MSRGLSKMQACIVEVLRMKRALSITEIVALTMPRTYRPEFEALREMAIDDAREHPRRLSNTYVNSAYRMMASLARRGLAIPVLNVEPRVWLADDIRFGEVEKVVPKKHLKRWKEDGALRVEVLGEDWDILTNQSQHLAASACFCGRVPNGHSGPHRGNPWENLAKQYKLLERTG